MSLLVTLENPSGILATLETPQSLSTFKTPSCLQSPSRSPSPTFPMYTKENRTRRGGRNKWSKQSKDGSSGDEDDKFNRNWTDLTSLLKNNKSSFGLIRYLMSVRAEKSKRSTDRLLYTIRAIILAKAIAPDEEEFYPLSQAEIEKNDAIMEDLDNEQTLVILWYCRGIRFAENDIVSCELIFSQADEWIDRCIPRGHEVGTLGRCDEKIMDEEQFCILCQFFHVLKDLVCYGAVTCAEKFTAADEAFGKYRHKRWLMMKSVAKTTVDCPVSEEASWKKKW